MNFHVDKSRKFKTSVDERWARNTWLTWDEVIEVLGGDADALRNEIPCQEVGGEMMWQACVVDLWKGDLE